MVKRNPHLGVCLAVSLLSACSHIPEHKPVVSATPSLPHSALLSKTIAEVPDLEDIFGLTAEQRQTFLRYFNAPEHQTLSSRQRLYNFLSVLTTGFDYQGKNHTAAEAFALKSGNCISLAVLTKALADVVGVQVKFQNIISAPVYDIQQGYLLSSDHVRTFLFEPDFVTRQGNEYLLQSVLVVDYLPSAGDITGPRISEQRFIAMFYRNLATDAFLQQNYSQALALLNTALEYDPTYGAVINLAAVLHRRLNQAETAEQFYRYGLQVADSKVALTDNYALLKQLQGDHTEAEQLRRSLRGKEDADPYMWYLLGKTALQQQRPADAVTYLKKAVARAPYMHQLYLELALAYYRNEQTSDAKRTLEKAAQLASTADTQQRYVAKLEAIKLSLATN